MQGTLLHFWWISVFYFSLFAASAKGRECVHIWYDSLSPIGRQHALFVQNLMGHFPEYQQIVRPIETYRAGELSECNSAIYISTYYRDSRKDKPSPSPIPTAFLEEIQKTKTRVAWLGYNTWLLPSKAQEELWGVNFMQLATLDKTNLDKEGFPGFFRDFTYKGETFTKYAAWDAKDPSRLHADFEIAVYDLVEWDTKTVVSWARHSTWHGEETPYIINQKNHWLVADSPFSYMYEEDRYLIFCDILFDILDAKPRWKKKPALFRLEDIHPRIPLWQLYGLSDYLKAEKIPFSMSLIPIFADPYLKIAETEADAFLPMSAAPEYLDFLEEAKRANASFIFHGVTHQYGSMKNPWNGLSGDDFEFWDRKNNTPLAEDSPRYVVERLELGLSELAVADIIPIAWLTPHYQASALDYHLLSQLFRWNVGRVIYTPHTLKTPEITLPEDLQMDAVGARGNGKRLAYLKEMAVDYGDGKLPSGQCFPYEIYGDVYGQRIIPEAVGNVQPYLNEQVFRVQTIDDLIRIVKRNRVLRDTWASFFLHPFRLESLENEGIAIVPGNLSEVHRLVTAIRESGYEFIDLKTWTRSEKRMRPKPIE